MAGARIAKRVAQEASTSGQWAEILAMGRLPGVINLGQGFPDFACHRVAAEAAQATLMQGRHDQYSPIPGSIRLQKAISALYQKMYPRAVAHAGMEGPSALDPATEVCVVAGGTAAIFCALMGLVDPGDEVIVFEPSFPWYLPCIRLAGGIPKPVRLMGPSFDLPSVEGELRKAFSSKTKLCIFNTPHNPTGHGASEADLSLLASLCREHDIVCLADEVYEACMFDNNPHRRICEVDGMWERTLTIGSASKLLHLTGWRVGWLTGPADLVMAARSMHTYTTFCAPAPLQEGVAVALESEISTLTFENRADLMHGNFGVLAKALRDTGVEVCQAEGGYFLIADVTATGLTDMEYCRWLAEEYKVVSVPMSFFYSSAPEGGPQLVRFAVCKERETIDKAINALRTCSVANAKRRKTS